MSDEVQRLPLGVGASRFTGAVVVGGGIAAADSVVRKKLQNVLAEVRGPARRR